MWKKPSIEKPDFNNFAIKELSEKEAYELNGGLSSSLRDLIPDLNPIKPFKPTPGLVAPPIKIPRDDLLPIDITFLG